MSKILIVDDLEENHMLVNLGLRKLPHELKHVYSGAEALDILKSFNADIILMDIQMPGIDGFETAKRIKELSNFADVPILFMSALKDTSNIVKCYHSGGVDYISKPFKIPELLARINTHLKINRLQRELTQERDKIHTILKNILPENYIQMLKNGQTPKPELQKNVIITFADFQDFTKLSEKLGPEKSVVHLNHLFSAFDDIIVQFGLERVKTLGDGYFAVAIPQSDVHLTALNAIASFLKVLEFVQFYNSKFQIDDWNLRIGMHIGNVITGIVGYQKIAFDIWGPSVNLASRMQSISDIDSITLTQELFDVVGKYVQLHKSDVVKIHRIGPKKVYRIKELNEQCDLNIRNTFQSIDPETIYNQIDTEMGLIKHLFN